MENKVTSAIYETRDPNDLLLSGLAEENLILVNSALFSGAKVTSQIYEDAFKSANLDVFEIVQSFSSIDFSDEIYSYLDSNNLIGLRDFISSRRSFSGCKISYLYNILDKYSHLDLFPIVYDLLTYCYRPSLSEYRLASDKKLPSVAKLINLFAEFFYDINFD